MEKVINIVRIYIVTIACLSLSAFVFADVKNSTSINADSQKNIHVDSKKINAKSGNSAVDHYLEILAEENKNNPQALAALARTADAVKSDPQKYINADGSMKMEEIKKMISQFSVGNISVPSPNISSEASNNVK